MDFFNISTDDSFLILVAGDQGMPDQHLIRQTDKVDTCEFAQYCFCVPAVDVSKPKSISSRAGLSHSCQQCCTAAKRGAEAQ